MNHTIEFVSRDHGGIRTIVTAHGVIDADVAIEDIRRGHSAYLAGPPTGRRVKVRAADAFGGPYLYANWDGGRKNNLHELALPKSPHAPMVRPTSLIQVVTATARAALEALYRPQR